MQIDVPAEAEQAAIDELAPRGFAIATVVPDTKPPEFFRVTSSGGTEVNQVTDEFLLTLESFAQTETAAADALGRAIGILIARARNAGEMGSEVAYMVRVSTDPQNFPMPSVPTHRRYTATLAARLRRRSVTI